MGSHLLFPHVWCEMQQWERLCCGKTMQMEVSCMFLAEEQGFKNFITLIASLGEEVTEEGSREN